MMMVNAICSWPCNNLIKKAWTKVLKIVRFPHADQKYLAITITISQKDPQISKDCKMKRNATILLNKNCLIM